MKSFAVDLDSLLTVAAAVLDAITPYRPLPGANGYRIVRPHTYPSPAGGPASTEPSSTPTATPTAQRRLP